MVTCVPFPIRLALKPLRIMPLGVPASKDHRSTLPLASFTSRKNHECGFSRRTWTIVPCTVTGLFMSKAAANEWCAHAAAANPSDARVHARTIRTVRFIRDLIFGNRSGPTILLPAAVRRSAAVHGEGQQHVARRMSG